MFVCFNKKKYEQTKIPQEGHYIDNSRTTFRSTLASFVSEIFHECCPFGNTPLPHVPHKIFCASASNYQILKNSNNLQRKHICESLCIRHRAHENLQMSRCMEGLVGEELGAYGGADLSPPPPYPTTHPLNPSTTQQSSYGAHVSSWCPTCPHPIPLQLSATVCLVCPF